MTTSRTPATAGSRTSTLHRDATTLAHALMAWRTTAWTGTVIDPWAHDARRRGVVRYLKVDGRNLAVPCPVVAEYGTRLTLLPEVR